MLSLHGKRSTIGAEKLVAYEHKPYAEQWMSSLRNGMANNCVFGTYRAPATKKSFLFSNFREPRNHPN
jgi:hypothetical protein